MAPTCWPTTATRAHRSSARPRTTARCCRRCRAATTPPPRPRTRAEAAMATRQFLWIVWPAFLAACLLQALVFALVDPHDVQWLHGSMAWSRQAVYAAAFFAFWGISMAACALTTLL